jgi:DNA-binding transcriptional MerR regulator
MNVKFKQGQVPEGHLTSSQILAVVGCSYRQLDYWCRTGLIDQHKVDGPGNGHWRSFTPQEALQVSRVHAMTEAGISLQMIRDIGERQIYRKGAVAIMVNNTTLEKLINPPSEENES